MDANAGRRVWRVVFWVACGSALAGVARVVASRFWPVGKPVTGFNHFLFSTMAGGISAALVGAAVGMVAAVFFTVPGHARLRLILILLLLAIALVCAFTTWEFLPEPEEVFLNSHGVVRSGTSQPEFLREAPWQGLARPVASASIPEGA